MFNLHSLKFKGTVSVISRDPGHKDDNPQFTKLPSKALSDQVWFRNQFL